MDNTPEKKFEEFRINMLIQKPMAGCMGPDYNHYAADEAYGKVLKLLAIDYKVLDSDFNKDDKLRAEYRANLRHAIHELFKLDCWESF